MYFSAKISVLSFLHLIQVKKKKKKTKKIAENY